MIVSSTNIAIASLISFYMLSAVFYCTCGKNVCSKNPRTETHGISFYLKDKNTGNDIFTSVQAVPDSIKLRNIKTREFYPLFVRLTVPGTFIYSNSYNRPANIIDSLEFKFGNSQLDTLVITTGIIQGWRGDECPPVEDASIIRVHLRNQLLAESYDDIAVFTLRK